MLLQCCNKASKCLKAWSPPRDWDRGKQSQTTPPPDLTISFPHSQLSTTPAELRGPLWPLRAAFMGYHCPQAVGMPPVLGVQQRWKAAHLSLHRTARGAAQAPRATDVLKADLLPAENPTAISPLCYRGRPSPTEFSLAYTARGPLPEQRTRRRGASTAPAPRCPAGARQDAAPAELEAPFRPSAAPPAPGPRPPAP